MNNRIVVSNTSGIILLLMYVLHATPAAAQTRDTNKGSAPSKRVNPFFQMGKDSVAIQRMEEGKAAQEKRENKTRTDTTTHATINSPTNYFMGEDKYLKVREKDHRYDTFQVYDIHKLDKKHAVVGLLTNTLERGTRYDDKGENAAKVVVSTGFVDKVDEQGKVIPGGTVAIASVRFNDKIFVIIGENDYRYLDGKRVVGAQQTVKELLKGKPITELTFYYELQKAGVIENAMTYKQFSALKLEDKFNILAPEASK